jgi:hypothetical protein
MPDNSDHSGFGMRQIHVTRVAPGVVAAMALQDGQRRHAKYRRQRRDVSPRDKEGTVRTSFKPGATLPVKHGEVVTTPPASS